MCIQINLVVSLLVKYEEYIILKYHIVIKNKFRIHEMKLSR